MLITISTTQSGILWQLNFVKQTWYLRCSSMEEFYYANEITRITQRVVIVVLMIGVHMTIIVSNIASNVLPIIQPL